MVFVVRDEVFIRIRIHLTILRGFRRVGVCTVIKKTIKLPYI